MIPKAADLKSSPMIHRAGDVFNPPGLTNFLGTVQVDVDVTGINSLNFPPFSCSDGKTAGLFIDGKYFPSYGVPVTTTWYPDRIERTAELNNLSLQSLTVLGINKNALMEDIRIRNSGKSRKKVEIKMLFKGGITKKVKPWLFPSVPAGASDNPFPDRHRKAFLFSSRELSAYNLQGVFPSPAEMKDESVIYYLDLAPGEGYSFQYLNILAGSRAEAEAEYDSLVRSVKTEIEKARYYWDQELEAVFTPGNDRYSGSLPELETSDEDIRKIYYTGIIGVIYFKRDNPNSVYGRAYDTLMPKYWQTVTFLWDYSLSSLVHALLDPVVMKKNLEKWMSTDIHEHFGTEYLTGGPVGQWYSVNDYAMTKMIKDYLSWSGDFSWLDRMVADKSGKHSKVIDFLENYSVHWKQIKSKNGLADYGGINNLLECVSTYIHEIASLNAGNIYNMRTAAEIFRLRGDVEKSADLLEQADMLLKDLTKLYKPGEGVWNVRYPDGKLVESRHCYDFITIMQTLSDDLSQIQKNEMCGFFNRELKSPLWMSALSIADDNVLFSTRPDHQWNGAYPAWPAQAVSALYAAGKGAEALAWLRNLARSANQGPFGQAHFTNAFINTENGGALKAANNEPYICDWAVSSGGSWVNIIIESIFGIRADLSGGLRAEPDFGSFDPEAELKNLCYRGKLYRVNRKGIFPQD